MNVLIAAGKLFFSCVYFFMKLGKPGRKVVFLSRQGDVPSVDYQMLAAALEAEGVKTEMYLQRQEKDAARFLGSAGGNLRMILRQMKALATARVAVTDGYSIPVSILRHRKALTVIQIWHAVGAIKKFGLQTLPCMSDQERRRTAALKMHRGYDLFAAPSKRTAQFFAEAFGMTPDKALITGTPYLDVLCSGAFGRKEEILRAYPVLDGGAADRFGRKRNVLYLPTYRPEHSARFGESTTESTNRQGTREAVRALAEALDSNRYNLIVRPHPLEGAAESGGGASAGLGAGEQSAGSDSGASAGLGAGEQSAGPDDGASAGSGAGEQSAGPDDGASACPTATGPNTGVGLGAGVFELPEFSAEELLSVADCVVTDYSSLALAAGLAGIPVYFFVYDIEAYRDSPGLNMDLEELYGRYTARDAQALADMIDGAYDADYARAFTDEYIEVFDGACTARLAAKIIESLQ
ncbi:MAG: CDP-glycerol glycerophosphotransferase family protein [Clostridiales Family XIII bacterium]|jgi:CDP-glycerol glycerophosphotransferase (TagB/SpsB family)|nr:CDP-glycerol glycerophosphotransferase family protein [Clostridiales Family XIII bacterium]